VFERNKDVALFAEEVMDVKIPRHHKKSRYEIIGHIVCKTDDLNDNELGNLVRALSTLTSENGDAKEIVQDKKERNVGWNEIIRRIASEAD
jgi:hypothetical protein